MLYKNFRSRKEVIDSCNYIFENIMSKNIGEIEYTKDEALNLGASFKENLDEKCNCRRTYRNSSYGKSSETRRRCHRIKSRSPERRVR